MKIKSFTSYLLLFFVFFSVGIYAQLPDGQTPGGKSWADSYQANGLCWCDTTFDHDLDDITKVSFTINGVKRNIRDICDELQYHPLVRDYVEGDPIYNDVQCGNGPANTAIDEVQCPGRVDEGREGCSEIGPQWDIEWLESRERFGGTTSNDCDYLDAFSVIQAEDFCEQYDIQTGSSNSIVGWVNDGDWVKYENVDFGSGVNTFKASVSSGSSGGNIQIRQGSTSGTLIGTLPVTNTGSWTTFSTKETSVSSLSGEQDIYLVFTGGSGYLLDVDWFQFSNDVIVNPPTADFTPDPNKTYYIDSAYHNLRLAASGESDTADAVSISTTGDEVEWKFVAKGNGSWHIQLAAGGSKPRLRTNNTEIANMQSTSYSGTYTYYTISTGYIANSYYLTLTDGPADHDRLQINSNDVVRMMPSANHAGTWESFYITEVVNNSVATNFSRLEAEDYDAMSGIQTEASSEGTDNVGWINNTDSIMFKDINLTGAQSIDARVACDYQGGDIEIRLGSETGQLLGTLTVVNTGGNQTYETVSTNLSSVSGVHDVYFVFKGGNGYLYNVNWLQFSSTARSSKEIQGANGVEVSAYPNPVMNNLTIANAAGGKFKAYDITGAEVLSSDIASNNVIVNVSTLVTGVYYFKVNYNNELTVIKVVKK